jgi:uncharacterized membrane protein YqaE (UPF0057 family)
LVLKSFVNPAGKRICGNLCESVAEVLLKRMKALRYFFCVVLPPVAVLMTGRLGSFLLSIVLTLLGWIPGIIHACLVVNDYHEEQRAARYAAAR